MNSPLSKLALAGLSLLPMLCAADDCVPWTWTWDNVREAAATDAPKPFQRAKITPYANKDDDPQPGDINCRSFGRVYDNVGYWSCNQLAQTYGITIEKFWMLNPELAPDCEGIQPNTEYCVDGFIEPVRATDGLCGPDHDNATCIGTDFGQCCNAETWKCGETEYDCSAGVCYEGLCPGHSIYTTDGKCGFDFGSSLCAGKWGDCCSFEGECGTGEDFCGEGKCQSGNCTEFGTPT